MASNRMLIDASHPEETRVVVVKGNRVEEFDFESEHKKQIRGNIYLAKVTRVEPSLQAAFVDYGGNRHGFLAFSEIHPDYYQIPVADRQALLRAEAEEARRAAEHDEDEEQSAADALDEADEREDDETEGDDDAAPRPKRRRRSRRRGRKSAAAEDGNDEASEDAVETTDEESDDGDDEVGADNESDDVVSEAAQGEEPPKRKRRTTRRKKADAEPAADDGAADEEPEAKAEAADEAEPEKPKRRRATRKKKEPVAEEAAEESIVEADGAEAVTADADTEEEAPKPKRRRTARRKKADDGEEATDAEAQAEIEGKEEPAPEGETDGDEADEADEKPRKRSRSRRSRKAKTDDRSGDKEAASNGDKPVEEMGSQDHLEEVPARRVNRRDYKIQEVIKRRQIMLVQVVKEERGNKGAALTTYLSLAGRYSVLMPNTARGGGISRKITNAADRKRLKSVASSLAVPDGMGVILRTAGASRKPDEIERDFEYLMRLWENVRTLTLESTAPSLVYEEGSLIKRSIRDLFDRDMSEIVVAGDQGHREAHDFMAMLMPEQAKRVKLYKERIPMFARFGVEAQLDAMLQPQVTLPSGGYIIIDQTEALVSIDVNSGRATRQHSIEETATQTNLEAADEVARQLRLRDLAGLIVIDFIDMDDKRNNRNVEKRLKDALKNDRARIQVGRISHFGLMEMSRQRMRASVLESTTMECPTCEGLGYVRAPSSVVLQVLRTIEESLLRSARNDVIVRVTSTTALGLLNTKRENLSDLEGRFGVTIEVVIDNHIGNVPCVLDKGAQATRRVADDGPVQPDTVQVQEDADEAPAQEWSHDSGAAEESEARGEDEEEGDGKRKRRRRRRRRGGDDEPASEGEGGAQASSDDNDDAGQDAGPPRSRRRRKRGDDEPVAETAQADGSDEAASSDAADSDETPEKKPRARRSSRGRKSEDGEAAVSDAQDGDAKAEEKPKRRRTSRKAKPEAAQPDAAADAEAKTETPSDEPARKPRRATGRPGKAERSDNAEPAQTGTAAEADGSGASDEAPVSEDPPRRARRNTRRVKDGEEAADTGADEQPAAAVAEAAVEETVSQEAEATKEKAPEKKGWWQRRFF